MTPVSVEVKLASWPGSVTLKCIFYLLKRGLGPLHCTAEAGGNATEFYSSFSPSTHLLAWHFTGLLQLPIWRYIFLTFNYGVHINCFHTI